MAKIGVHFLGIGGSGASAVANIAKSFGFEVTGCDVEPANEFTQDFKKEDLFKGHSSEHLKDVDILAVTPAIFSQDPNNSELLAAKKLGIEVLTWQEFMGKYLEEGKFVIAITGTHGKTTTTAMVAQVLEDANLDPTVELGTVVPKWNRNFRAGKSKFFVTEADEFNNNFLASTPDITVLTTLEMDHPEFFKDFEEYKNSFLRFLNKTKVKIFANLSDPRVREVMEVYQKAKENPNHPEIIDYSKSEINFPLKVIGEFNKLNATAAFQVGLGLGVDPTGLRNSLMQFAGTKRRQEHLGTFRGAEIYTDFGHHPTEIKKTVEAFREKYPNKRAVLVFQPHMFSRTKALFGDFVKVLKSLPVQQVMVMDIYPSREVDTGLVSSKELVEAIRDPKVAYIGGTGEIDKFLELAVRKGDLVIFMGAGDIDFLARKLLGNKE